MASGLRDFSSVFISKIVILILAVGTQSVLAWFLGPEGRGSYGVCIMLAGLLSVIFIPACDMTSIYFVSSGKMGLSEGIISAFIYGMIGSGIAVSAGFILMQFPISIFDKADLPSFYIAFVSIPFTLFAQVFSRILTATDDFMWFSSLAVLSRAVQLLLVVFMVGVFSFGVNGALLAVIFSSIITAFFSIIVLYFKYDLKIVKPQIKKLVDMFHYGLRYYVGKLSNLANTKVGTMILAFFATKAELGFFDVAMQLGTKTMLIPDTLTRVLTPKVAKDPKGKKQVVAMCARLTGIISAVVLLVLAIFAKPLVIVLFSPEFLPVVPLFRVIAIGVFIRSASKVFVPYLLGTDHPGIASVSVAVGTIINLILVWTLLPKLGLIAGGLAITAGYIASSAIIIISFKYYTGMSFKDMFKIKLSDFSFLKRIFQKLKLNSPRAR